MNQVNTVLAIAATTVLLLGVASGYIKNRLWVSEPLVALMIGILASPAALGIEGVGFSAADYSPVLLEFARITLAISIMGAALRLPAGWEARNWRELAVVLGVGMPLMWLAGSGLALALLGMPVLYCLLIGAALSPTDPVLADSILTGTSAEKAVPRRMRDMLTAESGANDGLAVLFVMLPVFLLGAPPGEAVRDWVVEVVVFDVAAGIGIGLVAGWLTARAFLWVLRREQSEYPSILTLAIALSLAVLSLGVMVGAAALLGVFTAGIVFNRATAVHEEAHHENMQAAVARFFDLPIFVLLGASLPWAGWAELGWRGAVFAVAVLLLRRLPAWFLLAPVMPSLRGWRETAFAGWFGPIGIAAVFYALQMQQHEHLAQAGRVWDVVSLVVFASIVLHGVSATPLTHAFGRRPGARDEREPEEDRAAEGERGLPADEEGEEDAAPPRRRPARDRA